MAHLAHANRGYQKCTLNKVLNANRKRKMFSPFSIYHSCPPPNNIILDSRHFALLSCRNLYIIGLSHFLSFLESSCHKHECTIAATVSFRYIHLNYIYGRTNSKMHECVQKRQSSTNVVFTSMDLSSF